MIEDWDLSATNLARLGQQQFEVAVLPTGSTEAHNRHLPEGLDVLHTTHVARRICREAWAQSPKVVCLPAIPYGVDCNLMDFPLSIHVSQATLDTMVREIIISLRHYGIRKVLILNGHGGNDFIPLIRQVQCDTDVHVFLCNWWLVGMDRYYEIFEKPDDHAGEFETSVALALAPEQVEMEKAGSGIPRPFRFEALRQGWVRTSRQFARLNDQCASGDPSLASAPKGQRYLDLICDRLGRFLVELAQAPLDDRFPQE